MFRFVLVPKPLMFSKLGCCRSYFCLPRIHSTWVCGGGRFLRFFPSSLQNTEGTPINVLYFNFSCLDRETFHFDFVFQKSQFERILALSQSGHGVTDATTFSAARSFGQMWSLKKWSLTQMTRCSDGVGRRNRLYILINIFC